MSNGIYREIEALKADRKNGESESVAQKESFANHMRNSLGKQIKEGIEESKQERNRKKGFWERIFDIL